jgi:hypothetical protein
MLEMLVRRALALSGLLILIGCGDGGPDLGVADGGNPLPDGSSQSDLKRPASCPTVPTAYVFDHSDPYTRVEGASGFLSRAGFDVQVLPLDRSPMELSGLIFLATFASESSAYRTYMNKYAADLQAFVAQGNVIVQMTQADQTEATPPFLPPTLKARRSDLDVNRVYTLDPFHRLIKDIPAYMHSGSLVTERYLVYETGALGWETFVDHQGFEVILSDGPNARNAVMLEGEYGAGRVLLTALSLDKPHIQSPERDKIVVAFFNNLVPYVQRVCEGTAHVLRVMPGPMANVFTPGAWVLPVLPDTQYYTLVDQPQWRGLFTLQTVWIAQNARRLNIPYVLQLGDLVSHNEPKEWEFAERAMSVLDGVVPYAIVGGNHDYGPDGSASTRDTLMNDFFSYDKTAAWPTFGGAYQTGKLDNTYHLFSAGGRDFIVLALEWGPRDEVIAWANSVMSNHPDRWGIMFTHAYTNWNDRRYDFRETGNPQNPQHFNPHEYSTPGVNDGEELWLKLISRHRFAMVFSGHVLADGSGYLVSQTQLGNRCHQMLSNYQNRPLGGAGYMRLLNFEADNKTVRVFSYSPYDDAFYWDYDQYYTFTLD